MPSGRLGAVVLTPNQWTPVFVCPANRCGSFNLYLINETGQDAQVKVAIVDGAPGDRAPEDTIDAPVDRLNGFGGTYRLTGEPIGNIHGGTVETVLVWADRACTAHARGFIGEPVFGEA